MDTLEQFIQKFSTAIDFPEPVLPTADTPLDDIPEWDSLGALGVIVMFDCEYGKTIESDDLQRCKTVADLFALASGALAAVGTDA